MLFRCVLTSSQRFLQNWVGAHHKQTQCWGWCYIRASCALHFSSKGWSEHRISSCFKQDTIPAKLSAWMCGSEPLLPSPMARRSREEIKEVFFLPPLQRPKTKQPEDLVPVWHLICQTRSEKPLPIALEDLGIREHMNKSGFNTSVFVYIRANLRFWNASPA